MNPQSAELQDPEIRENLALNPKSRQKYFQNPPIRSPIHPAQGIGFRPGLKFSRTTNERGSISRAILEIEANAVIYIHTSNISNEASFEHRQPRQARTRPELVCCEAW